MNFFEIETFLTIASTRSLSLAAKRLYLSQATVSYRLQSLERELGSKLIIRKRGLRYVELTNEGESFLPIAERWLDVYRSAELWKLTPTSQELAIAGLETFNTYVIIPFISRFLNDKQIKFRIRSKANREAYDLIANHEVDLAFVSSVLNYPNVDFELLYTERYVVCSSRLTHLQGKSLYIKDLPPSKEIFQFWNDEFLAWHNTSASSLSKIAIELDIVPMVIGFLKERDYWMITPITTAVALKEQHGIPYYEMADGPAPRHIYKISRKNKDSSKVEIISKFLDQFLKYIGNLKEIVITD